MFRVGQKVVCVKPPLFKRGGFVKYGYGWEIVPVKDQVYTIREIGMGLSLCFPNILAVRLEEIVNKPATYTGGFYETVFSADRFRPLVEKTTDISVFTEMLKEMETV